MYLQCSPELVPHITSDPPDPGDVTVNESCRHCPIAVCATPIPFPGFTPLSRLNAMPPAPSLGSPIANVVKSSLSWAILSSILQITALQAPGSGLLD